jgi:polar amino acid transport system substrate-binding protein
MIDHSKEEPMKPTRTHKLASVIFNRLAFAVVASLAVVALATSSSAQPAPLSVGILTTAPFGGTPPGGYCVDLMNEIGARTGLQFEYLPTALGELLPNLVGGTTDIVCSALGATNERRALGIAFTSAILTNSEALIVLATDATPYTRLEEFRGQPVGANEATLFVGYLQTAGGEVRTFASAALAYQALIAGEIRAVVNSAPAFLYQQRVLGQWPELRAVDTYVATHPIFPAIAVRNTDTELLGALQAALEAIKADGAMVAILERWALAPPPF